MLLCGTVGWIHVSIGRPERWLRWTFVELTLSVSLFLASLSWGPAGIAAAWSISYWILLFPGFWYAGRPIGLGLSALMASISRYAAASLMAGFTTAVIIRRTALWGEPSSAHNAFIAVIVTSALFITLYLGTVILVHWGLAPLRQFVVLLRELNLR